MPRGEVLKRNCKLQIENCKLRIAVMCRRVARFCNLHFATCILQSLLVLGVLIGLSLWMGLTSSPANARELFSLEQARDRTGHGGFPHDQKEHLKIVCADCHLSGKERPARTDQPMAKDFPHLACIRCHNFAAEFFKTAMGQPSRFCGVCHETRRISRLDKALKPGVFPKPQLSDFDDAFSHKAHRKTLPADFRIVPTSNPPYGLQFKAGETPRCTDCHEQIEKARSDSKDSKDMRTESNHAACFTCHGGAIPEPRSVSAESFPYANDCKVCHELNVLGTSARSFSLFRGIKGFRHDDHDLDIRPKKRSDFPLPTAPDRLCSECHKPIDQIEKLNAIRLPEAGSCNTCHIDKKPGLPGRLSDEVLNKLKRD